MEIFNPDILACLCQGGMQGSTEENCRAPNFKAILAGHRLGKWKM
jgi:hypothetical protein